MVHLLCPVSLTVSTFAVADLVAQTGKSFFVYGGQPGNATGFNANDDDRAGIQLAIDQARLWLIQNPTLGPAKVVFEANGVYHLDSSIPGPDPAFVLDIRNFPDNTGGLVLVGKRATLVHRNAEATDETLGISASHDITIENLTFDRTVPPYMDSVVNSVVGNDVTVTRVRGAHVAQFPAAATMRWGWLLDPLVPGRPKTGSASSYQATSVVQSPQNPDVYTFTIQPMNGVPVATDFVANDRFTYHYRAGGNNIQIRGLSEAAPSTNIRLNQVRSYASASMFVNAQWVDGLVMTGCEVAIKSGHWRSTNGDAFHVKHSDHVTIEGCSVTGVSDDAINLSLVDQFSVRSCVFADKRRHGIFLDSDDDSTFLMANSTNGLIELNTASGNGGSFLVHRGGDYATVTIGANTHSGNNLNRSEGRCWQARIVGAAAGGPVYVVPSAGPNGTWDDGDAALALANQSGTISAWDVQEVLDVGEPAPGRLLFTSRALRDLNVWLYLAPVSATAGATVTMQAPSGALNDPEHYWRSELGTTSGTVRYRLHQSALYLARTATGRLVVQTLNPADPKQEWTLDPAPGN